MDCESDPKPVQTGLQLVHVTLRIRRTKDQTAMKLPWTGLVVLSDQFEIQSSSVWSSAWGTGPSNSMFYTFFLHPFENSSSWSCTNAVFNNCSPDQPMDILWSTNSFWWPLSRITSTRAISWSSLQFQFDIILPLQPGKPEGNLTFSFFFIQVALHMLTLWNLLNNSLISPQSTSLFHSSPDIHISMTQVNLTA